MVSNEALGAYLRHLIKGHPDLTVADVSDRAGVSLNYLHRLANGTTKEPSARLLHSLVRAARGDIREAMVLLANAHATAADGEAMARARLMFEADESTEWERQRAAFELERLANDLDGNS